MKTITCIVCGTEKSSWPYRKGHKFCSQACHYKHKKGTPATPKQLEALKKGHGWNKGLTGKLSHQHGRRWTLKKDAWNKGKKFPEKTGENNPNWKGDEAGYDALHRWVERKLGKPNKCSHCEKTNCVLDWANIDHTYKRNTEDWLRLCRPCHRKRDHNFGRRIGKSQ